MCWISFDRKPYKRVAKRDIKVYKYLIPYKSHFEAPFQNYSYRVNVPNIIVTIKPEIIHNQCSYGWNDYWNIYEGYHSYTLNKALQVDHWYKFGCKLVECIIPKGTIFYTNDYREIVSENIIITKKCVG